MSVKSEDQIILKLILKGQSKSDIIDHLQKRGMVDKISIYRIESKIREMKAAQAFLPYTPNFFDRFSRAILGVFIVLFGMFFLLVGIRGGWRTGMLGGGIVVAGGVSCILKGLRRSRW